MPRFYIGQPVICVDDRLNAWLIRHHPNVTWVTRGQRYTIRAHQQAVMPVNRHMNFVLLHEIRNPIVPWSDGQYMEAGFWEERFEPATDISELDRIAQKIGEWGKSSDWDRNVKRRERKKERA